MELYRIVVRKSEEWQNSEIDSFFELSEEKVKGIIAVATAIFDPNRDYFFTIYNKYDQILNVDEILKQSEAIFFEGEAAIDLQPEPEKSWTDLISEQARFHRHHDIVPKVYTVKAAGTDGMYLFQFDDLDFYRGMAGVVKLIGLSPEDILVYLHKGNTPMTVQ